MSANFKSAGFYVVVAVATIFSASSSMLGAEAAGWQQSQWAIIVAWPIVFGFLVGCALSLLSYGIVVSIRSYPEALAAALICPLAGTFVGAYLIAHNMVAPERAVTQQLTEINARIASNPQALRDLINAAHTRPLTGAEVLAIEGRLSQRNTLRDDEIPFLLKYFDGDDFAICQIIYCQKVTPDQLRALYQEDKDDPRGANVVHAIFNDPLTPKDIVADIEKKWPPRRP